MALPSRGNAKRMMPLVVSIDHVKMSKSPMSTSEPRFMKVVTMKFIAPSVVEIPLR